MKTEGKIMVIAAFLSALVGCAVTPISAEAQNVRMISEQEASSCRFIDAVSSNNSNTLSQNPEQEARNRAMNRVAELGGNALRIITTNNQIAPSGLGSIFSLTGEAYSCG